MQLWGPGLVVLALAVFTSADLMLWEVTGDGTDGRPFCVRDKCTDRKTKLPFPTTPENIETCANGVCRAAGYARGMYAVQSYAGTLCVQDWTDPTQRSVYNIDLNNTYTNQVRDDQMTVRAYCEARWTPPVLQGAATLWSDGTQELPHCTWTNASTASCSSGNTLLRKECAQALCRAVRFTCCIFTHTTLHTHASQTHAHIQQRQCVIQACGFCCSWPIFRVDTHTAHPQTHSISVLAVWRLG
eukprot:m.4924 g.4924  ORF g.4924 m.4924 type:complete len:243 (-) comp4715_c0_seq2:119-847(-)